MFLKTTTEILETRGTFQLKMKQNTQPSSLPWCVSLYQEQQLLEAWKTQMRQAHPLHLLPHRYTFLSEAFPSQGSGVLPTQFTARHSSPSSRACGSCAPQVIAGIQLHIIKPTTHQNSKTCSTKRLQNMLNPYPALVPYLTWANQKAHFAHRKSSSISSSLH